jgi:PAS domain S-box-containing protein
MAPVKEPRKAAVPADAAELAARLERSEARALALEERYALLMRGADDGLWDWDLTTNAIEFSARWKQILGYEDHEIANDPEEWRSRVHPDDLGPATAAMSHYLDGLSPSYYFELRMRHKDGGFRWIATRGAALRDGDGRAYRMAGAHWDITARKRAEELLREREQQYRGIFVATTDAMLICDLDTGLVVEVNPAGCRLFGYERDELVGLHPSVLIHPNQRARYADFLDTARSGGELRRRALNVRRDGELIHVDVRGTAFQHQGRPHLLCIVRDIGAEVESFQRLEQRVEERTLELSSLLDVSKTLTATLELQPLLDAIMDKLHVISEYISCSMVTIEADELVTRAYRGPIDAEAVMQRRYPVVRPSPTWSFLLRGEAAIIPDVWADTAEARNHRATMGEDWLRTRASYIRCWLSVPLTHQGRPVGLLVLTHQTPGHFTSRHAALATAIASQVAAAVENAQLYERAQQAAALEERQRLARELHDSVSQALFGIGLGARTARTLLERNEPARALRSVEYVASLAETGMAEMRALLFELRPESLATEGLVAALTKQADALHARHGLAVEIDLCAEPEAPLEVKEAFYRIAQEAMHNTVKHAQATRLTLRLAADGGALRLEVRDDGAGFDPSGFFPGHLGLRSMRERAARVGAGLGVESAPGAGTVIRVAVALS